MIALSPEWDRWFDETFTNLITNDPDLVRTEFNALMYAAPTQPPTHSSPPATTSHTPGDCPTVDSPGRDSPAEKG